MDYLLIWLCVIIMQFVGCVYGLECWRCIADDCHLDPANNYKASKVMCRDDEESCQKVEYSGRDNWSGQDYFSVVRSCSQGKCIPHVDNCTHILKTNPGCMVRTCCNNRSLCNAAAGLSKTNYWSTKFRVVTLGILVVMHRCVNYLCH